MSSPVVIIADGVVNSLNAGAYSMSFAATRSYRPTVDALKLATLTVLVVPKGAELQLATRGADDRPVEIDVAVGKKVSLGEDGEPVLAEVDALMDLVEEIVQRLRQTELGTTPLAVFEKLVNKPVFNPQHLNEMHLFTSVITVTFRLQT